MSSFIKAINAEVRFDAEHLRAQHLNSADASKLSWFELAPLRAMAPTVVPPQFRAQKFLPDALRVHQESNGNADRGAQDQNKKSAVLLQTTPSQNPVVFEINAEINQMLARNYAATSGANNFLELALSLLPPAAKLVPAAFLSIKSITNPFALASLQQAPHTTKLAHEAATAAINSLQQAPWLQIRLRGAQALMLDVNAKNVGDRIKIIDSLLEEVMTASLRSGGASGKGASAWAHNGHAKNLAALEKTNRTMQGIKAVLESQQKAFAAKP